MAYVASTLGTYSTGTVTVVNGSTAVTGSGTVWGDIVNEGDLFTIDDDKFYYVAALNSDTSLTLDKPYAESSASGINYRVMLNTAAHFPSDVAAKVERALSGMGDVYCPINHASSGSDYGLASASLYGHAKASGTTPKAPGTAAVGTETNKFARGDHVHPHDDTKLDVAGGQMSGTIITKVHPALSRNNDNSYLTLCGGTAATVSNGAYMYLYGADGSQPGAFRIYTGSSSHNLFGKSDGTLTWDGNDVITSAGGTISGTLKFSGDYDILSDSNDKRINIFAGTNGNSMNGAKCILHGGSYTDPGWFILQAGNVNGYKQLVGKPDGTLTWGGSGIVTLSQYALSSTTTAPRTYKTKLPNGVMIQALYNTSLTTDANSRVEWTFDEAFLESPYFGLLSTNANHYFNLYAQSTTKLTLRVNDNSGALVGSGVTVGASIIAVGRWK